MIWSNDLVKKMNLPLNDYNIKLSSLLLHLSQDWQGLNTNLILYMTIFLFTTQSIYNPVINIMFPHSSYFVFLHSMS